MSFFKYTSLVCSLFLSTASLYAQGQNISSDEPVTVREYCQFLNEVATTDFKDFYQEKMKGIIRSEVPGSYRYTVQQGEEESFINYISPLAAMCYRDWKSSSITTFNVECCEGALEDTDFSCSADYQLFSSIFHFANSVVSKTSASLSNPDGDFSLEETVEAAMVLAAAALASENSGNNNREEGNIASSSQHHAVAPLPVPSHQEGGIGSSSEAATVAMEEITVATSSSDHGEVSGVQNPFSNFLNGQLAMPAGGRSAKQILRDAMAAQARSLGFSDAQITLKFAERDLHNAQNMLEQNEGHVAQLVDRTDRDQDYFECLMKIQEEGVQCQGEVTRCQATYDALAAEGTELPTAASGWPFPEN